MKKFLTIAVLMLAGAPSLLAQDWSFGAATGPFVFGDFLERRLRPTTGGNPSPEAGTLVLSAATRPGLALDIERKLSHRWAVRLEGTFTRSPLSIKQEDGGGVDLDAGELDVSTWMLPVVFRINTGGTFRFHLLAGPALALYRATGDNPAFDDTQAEWGAAFGGGVGWWLSDRFAIEGNITDTITSSPLDREDFPDAPGIKIPRVHNAHGTVGVRWRF